MQNVSKIQRFAGNDGDIASLGGWDCQFQKEKSTASSVWKLHKF